jgi:hypothetical protein
LIITNTNAVRRVAAGNYSQDDFSTATEMISGQIDEWQIEYCTLVNASKHIIVGGNNNRSGELFDPSEIVSYALETKHRIFVSVTMEYGEFAKEGSKRFL